MAYKKSYYSREGYKQIYAPNSPSARTGSYKTGYAPEHRVVLEQKLGRPIKSGNHSHHWNFDKKDNRPQNLIEMPRVKHLNLHRRFKLF